MRVPTHIEFWKGPGPAGPMIDASGIPNMKMRETKNRAQSTAQYGKYGEAGVDARQHRGVS